MQIRKEIYDELVEISRRNSPNEACAYLFENNTRIIEAFPTDRSSAHFSSIDPEIVAKMVDKYGPPTALFHSHPCQATPSFTDKTHMLPTTLVWGAPWLIMSDREVLRAWVMKISIIGNFPNLVEEVAVELI